MSGALLEVRGLTKHFGGLTAVRAVDFTVTPGQIKAVIGPNGAGKTTIFNMVGGLVIPSAGRVVFDGAPLPIGSPHAVAGRGIGRTFQLVQLFGEMTVLDNVLVGCHRDGRAGWLACALRTGAMREEERRLRQRAIDVLELVGLAPAADLPAAVLPYGEQRLVELARAVAMRPRLLLLDEPGAGLDAEEQRRLAAVIRQIRDGGTSVLLIDHHVDFVLELADEVLVLSYGEKLAEGPPRAIRRDPSVLAAYLGDEDEAC